MKPKATTMQQRMGFSDPDLTSSKHDEIILWLVENCEQVARAIGGFKGEPFLSMGHRCADEWRKDAMVKFEAEKEGRCPQFSIRLESPIMDRTFIVGFVDAIITVASPCLRCYADDHRPAYHWDWSKAAEFYVEVKPSIPSFGEVLRQIRHYQAYCGSATMLVCSPDIRFKTHIEQQDIGFIVYPS